MRSLRAFLGGRDSDGGQAIILIAITMLAMLMVVGLAIDAGQLYSARRAMQEAADAAAYAGSVTRYQGGTESDGWTAAAADATRNGYTHNVNGVSVTIQRPTTPPFNTSDFIEVTISASVRTSLVPAEAGITTVAVHAISGAESLNNDFAIIALDRNSTPDAFNAGSAQISITGGGVHTNSTSTTAANGGTASWSISCPSSNPCNIDSSGGSTGTFPAANAGDHYNGVQTNQTQIPDPFAGYPKPSTSGMTLDPAPFNSNQTLRSGIYDYQISGKKLCHGIYILKGGGMGGDVTNDTGSIDPGTGLQCDGKVLIFNTMSNYPSTGGTCTGVDITGNHEVSDLQPMTSGTYKGLLFYQDPSCTEPMSLGSSAFAFQVGGTIYLPNAAFTISGGHPEIQGGQIVAKTVDLGAASVAINFTSTNSAQPVLPRLAK